MSEYEQVIDEIVKHGVGVKVNKVVDDNYIPYERKYVGCVVELDFSEHDKVFEDKIARLEENVGYYKDSLSRVEKNCEKLHCENKELKQRIADLESKETEKPTKINLNDRIKVKLTPLGAEIYYHQYDDIHKDYPKMKKHLQSSLPKVDENGYTEFQLWHFMELYGEHIGMCKPNVINPLNIIIVK